MPMLSKYRFDRSAGCINHQTKRKQAILKKKGKLPVYSIYTDDGKKATITLREVQQYINHLLQVEQFNPLVYHHFVTYRPIIKLIWSNRKINNLTL